MRSDEMRLRRRRLGRLVQTGRVVEAGGVVLRVGGGARRVDLPGRRAGDDPTHDRSDLCDLLMALAVPEVRAARDSIVAVAPRAAAPVVAATDLQARGAAGVRLLPRGGAQIVLGAVEDVLIDVAGDPRHRLSRETLYKLRTTYAGGLIGRLRTEQDRARQGTTRAE